MGANDYQGNLTPSPENEPEQKKKKGNKKKAVLLGLAALVVLGGASVLCRSGITDRPQPPRQEQEASEVAVVVEPTDTVYVAPQELESAVEEPESKPVDVREGWHGGYEGTSIGRVETLGVGTYDLQKDMLWLDIMDYEWCLENSFCGDDRSWGIDIGTYGCIENGVYYFGINLYLPEDLNDAPNLTITDSKITISPTEEHPYVLEIEKVDDQIEGNLQVQGVLDSTGKGVDWWTVDYLTVGLSQEKHPCSR